MTGQASLVVEGGEPPDICLVTMPYAALSRPSLALSLLKGVLGREGITAVVAQANLWFAEQVGLRRYHLCSAQMPTEFLAGEWTFAGAAFSDSSDRDEDYLQQLAAANTRGSSPGRGAGEVLVADLRSLRAAATQFIDDVARRVLATGTRVIGCTSTFEQHVASLALLRRIRELDSGVITMLGGANCETVMGQTTHRCFPWVDYVVSGEADGLIAKLCRLALTRGRNVEPEELPPGVLGPPHRDDARSPVTGSCLPRALFRKLDSLPFPQFGDYFTALNESPLRANIRPGLPVETSRGCWWGARHQCTFCGLNGSSLSFDSKTPDRVLAEIHELEEQYGISSFEVVDNILDMAYFKTLLPRLAEDARPRQLFYEVKANLSRRHVETLVSAGVTWVQPGIESLHSEALRLMDKGVQGWQNIQLLKWARELGLRMSWSLLWGFPGEQDEWYRTMAGWIPLLEHLQAPAGLMRLRYDRYSVYHQQAQRLGLRLLPVWAMSYIYPVSHADLEGLAYFFTTETDFGPPGPTYGARRDHPARPGIRATREAVHRWRAAFNVDLRPVLSMKDCGEILDIVDSRSCAGSQRIVLSGLARVVCLACDAAPRADQLVMILKRDFDTAASTEELAGVVDQLVAERLLLPIDGRLVSLAVKGVIPELPHRTQFPGGFVDERIAVSDFSGTRVDS